MSGVVDGQIVNVIIDRTFVDSTGLRWIIDFKTSSHEGGAGEAFLDAEVERYRPQLARYARVVSGLARYPVRVGLYFPLLDGWREWTPPQKRRALAATLGHHRQGIGAPGGKVRYLAEDLCLAGRFRGNVRRRHLLLGGIDRLAQKSTHFRRQMPLQHQRTDVIVEVNSL